MSVHRKDCKHPFRFRGRYKGPNKTFGPEMAVKCAEVMGLRRAFDVSLPSDVERWDMEAAAPEAHEMTRPLVPVLPQAPEEEEANVKVEIVEQLPDQVTHEYAPRTEPERRPLEALVEEGATPECPECSTEMVIKSSKAGNKFWSCSAFPKCRGTRSVDSNYPAPA